MHIRVYIFTYMQLHLLHIQHTQSGPFLGLYTITVFNIWQVQIFSGVVSLPWAMKPVVGLTSDVAPIFGYHKAAAKVRNHQDMGNLRLMKAPILN